MNKEIFVEELKKINIVLSDRQLEQLNIYYEYLVFCNEKINLTAITNEKDVYLKHFYDSLTLIKAIDLNKEILLCDVGTGAGFPGMVLKIVFPKLNVTLIDSLEKRTRFLQQLKGKLKIEVEIIHSRIEDIKEYEKYDIVVSRAVSKINILLELGCQLVKTNGLFVLMKGNIKEELDLSKTAIEELNYKVIQVKSFKLPIENSERNILVLKHINRTNKKYPRDFSKIKKRPL